jgi:hypothetical protein
VPVVLVDGTGVGFDTPFYAQFRRGAEVGRIRPHLKVVVLVYCRGVVTNGESHLIPSLKCHISKRFDGITDPLTFQPLRQG